MFQSTLTKLACLAVAITTATALAPVPTAAHEGFVNCNAAPVQTLLNETFAHADSGMVIGLVDERGSRVLSAGRMGDGTGRRVDGETVFEIGSVTKTFTALLLLDMVRRREVKIDDPVAKYLPPEVTVPSHGKKAIQLLHLAAQDSGLPFDADYAVGEDGRKLHGDALWRAFNEHGVEDMYVFLSDHQLATEPGASFQYSNVGMSLLGHALELAAGTDYESLVVERLCRPLNMNNTRITLTPDLEACAARGFGKDGEPAELLRLQAIAPSGGLRSTANDLLKYISANLGLCESPLNPLMAESHVIRHRDSPELGKTAMPWYDNGVYNPPGSELLGHSGGTFGFSTFIGFDMKRRRGVVVVSNQRKLPSGGIGWSLLQGMPVSRQSFTRLLREPVPDRRVRNGGCDKEADRETSE